MAKYLLLKHYRGAPAAVNDVPMEHWTPEEVSDHIQFMRDFAARLQETASSSTRKRWHPRDSGFATTGRAGHRSPMDRSRRPRT